MGGVFESRSREERSTATPLARAPAGTSLSAGLDIGNQAALHAGGAAAIGPGAGNQALQGAFEGERSSSFARNMLLHGSITPEWADNLDDDALVRAADALHTHMALLLAGSPGHDAALTNFRVLQHEAELRGYAYEKRDQAALEIATRSGGPPVVFGFDTTTRSFYMSVTPGGASFEEIATYVYGAPGFAGELAFENLSLLGQPLPAGTVLRPIKERESSVASATMQAGLRSGAMMRSAGIPEAVEDDGAVHSIRTPLGTMNLTSGQSKSVLDNMRRKVRSDLQIHIESLEFLGDLRDRHYKETDPFVRATSDDLGDAEMPSASDYAVEIARGKALLGELDTVEFLEGKPTPEDAAAQAARLDDLRAKAGVVVAGEQRLERKWEDYIEATVRGAEKQVSRLEFVRNASFGMVASMAGFGAAGLAFRGLTSMSFMGRAVFSLGPAAAAGGTVRAGLETFFPGAQADVPVHERVRSSFWSGSVQGGLGAVTGFLAPGVNSLVTGGTSRLFGQSFVQSMPGRIATTSVSAAALGAPAGAAGTALELLPDYAQGRMNAGDYHAAIKSGLFWGAATAPLSAAIPVKGMYRDGGKLFRGDPVMPRWAFDTGMFPQPATLRGDTRGFHNLTAERLPVFADPSVAGHGWVRVRSGRVDEWLPVRNSGPRQEFELAWYADPADPANTANFNFLYGPAGNPNALRLADMRQNLLPRAGQYTGLAADTPVVGMPRSTRQDMPATPADMAVRMPDGTLRPMIVGHNVDYKFTTPRTATIPNSSLDIRNITPEPWGWGGAPKTAPPHLRGFGGREALIARMLRGQSAGGTEVRQIAVYARDPPLSVSGKPSLDHIYFVEVGPNGGAVRAWRVPFGDPGDFNGIRMSRAAQVDINFEMPDLAALPRVVVYEGARIPASVLAAAGLALEEAEAAAP